MIFVTVGTQLPFDRLVRAVDDWARSRERSDVFAQIGPGEYVPASFRSKPFLSPDEFAQCCAESSAIVAHAGMGSLLTALELRKPIIVMPRRAALHEHRNDHQLATAERFRSTGGVTVADDEAELGQRLDALDESAAGGEGLGPHASASLIAAVRGAIMPSGRR